MTIYSFCEAKHARLHFTKIEELKTFNSIIDISKLANENYIHSVFFNFFSVPLHIATMGLTSSSTHRSGTTFQLFQNSQIFLSIFEYF